MDARSRDRFSSVLNGVAYRLPTAPVAVVCVDGGDPEYLTAAGAAGLIPTITRFMREGFSARLPGQILQVIGIMNYRTNFYLDLTDLHGVD